MNLVLMKKQSAYQNQKSKFNALNNVYLYYESIRLFKHKIGRYVEY